MIWCNHATTAIFWHILVFYFIHDSIACNKRHNNNGFERQSGATRLCLSNRWYSKGDANTTSANYTLPHTAAFSISPLPLLATSVLLFLPTLHPTSPAHSFPSFPARRLALEVDAHLDHPPQVPQRHENNSCTLSYLNTNTDRAGRVRGLGWDGIARTREGRVLRWGCIAGWGGGMVEVEYDLEEFGDNNGVEVVVGIGVGVGAGTGMEGWIFGVVVVEGMMLNSKERLSSLMAEKSTESESFLMGYCCL